MTEAPTSASNRALWPLATALIALWLPVFYRLSGIWETNEQYSHGWFVPLLAAWIFYTRWQTLPTSPSHLPTFPPSYSPSVTRHSSLGPLVLWSFLLLLLLPLAGSYLIAESNPEWRMMMWIMAACAFLASLLLTQIYGGTPWTKHLWFAYFFALVSVPWPYVPEKWLTFHLSMIAAQVSTSILTLIGIPAVCVGNTIEVAAGVLGVDEACSGIRSFQSSLMAGLFLGELYMLRLAPRIILCLSGLIVAYALNIGRMLVLSIAVETSGTMDAIGKWHDPAGFVILLLTMAALWALCALAAKFGFTHAVVVRRGERKGGPSVSRPPSPDPSSPITKSPNNSIAQESPSSASHAVVAKRAGGSLVPIVVVAAMLLTAIGTEAWFRYKEIGIRNAPAWSIASAGESAVEKPLADYVKGMLKYDEGFERSWTDTHGNQWHLIYLRWNPTRMAVHRASPHQPEICQTGAGRQVLSKSEAKVATVHGIPIRYHIYEIRAGSEKFHLMFVPNDDRTVDQLLDTMAFKGSEGAERSERLQRVRQGRRYLGQRSMQLALVGVEDAATAEKAMLEILPTLIQRND